MSTTKKRKKNAPTSATNAKDKRSVDTPSTNDPKRRRPFLSYAVLLTAGLLTLFSGLLHGKLRNQWGLPAEAMAAAERLKTLPEQFGDWKMVTEYEPQKTVVEILECVGYQHRSYVNQETGRVVTVAIILGPTGPTSVHTPEICYSSRDYSILQKRRAVQLRSGKSELWAMTFQSKDIDQKLLRVYYGWTFDGPWTASKNTRLAHIGHPYLYKIQVATQCANSENLEDSDSCRDFLEELIPVLQRHQFNKK